ncbi:hypothetical protein E2C01_079045 [Portunus trituberculatus]|uniref:Endonuclease/exonuclease/phosphatase domain-containing protein n=1 Tax=Portunus trituberculatus TaxID=210409 RepID=A0A5B7IUI4_PORTR|nr:hypothetical protein [Portunus trituberculatus]
MTREDIHVEELQYRDGHEEVVSITIRTSEREKRSIIVTYVPPKINKEMQREVLNCLENMLRKDRSVLLADLNFKHVNWEEMDTNSQAGRWGEEVLQLVMVNTLDQWLKDYKI